MKDKFFQLRLSEQDRKRLDTISEHHGRGKADMLRRLIIEEYQRITNASSATAPDEPKVEWGMIDKE